MKYKTQIIMAISIISIIILFLILVSWIIPIRTNDMECFEKIAYDTCLNGETTENIWYKAASINSLYYSDYNFECCEYKYNNNSRKIKNKICEKYIFLEEDYKKCSKIYQFWKRQE